MAKKKVHELAKEFEVQSKDIIGFFAEQGIDKKAGSNVEDQEYDMVKAKFSKKNDAPVKAAPEKTEVKGKSDTPVLRPVSVDGRPVSSDGRRVVAGAERKAAPDAKRPMSVDGRRPMPTDGRRPMPTDGRRPMPTDGRRPMPTDGRRPMQSV